MKLLHLSDFHIGKNIGSYSLLEDQKYCLGQILEIIKNENIDIVIIAGDIFDTSIPNSESMKVYSDFVDRIIFDFKKKIQEKDLKFLKVFLKKILIIFLVILLMNL